MILLLLGALAIQATQTRPATVVRDSSAADTSARRAPRRLPVTAQVLATAFRDSTARELFQRARAARMAQDSSLKSYEAEVRTRRTIGMAIGERGPERLVMRTESASTVRWQQGIGAYVDLTGARGAIPIIPSKAEQDEYLVNLVDGTDAVIPYFPGHEVLWIGGRAQRDVDDRRLVNPLANGAEAYYTYETGDSLRIALPGGTAVQLVELRVRPRSASWNLAVGSLMVDMASGELVRAAYRLAAPIDMWTVMAQQADTNRDTRRAIALMKVFAPQVKSEISDIVIEYGLHQERFWLPRSRTMRGFQEAASIRLPIAIEYSFRYSAVNSGLSLAPIVPNVPNFLAPVEAPDSLKGPEAARWRDSVMRANRVARDALRDSLATGPCDPNGTRTLSRARYEGELSITMTFPCDVEKLKSSPVFEKPIYDAGEDAFGARERQELIDRALALGAQAPFDLLRAGLPQLQYGLSLTRYNRVEGLSTGLKVEQQLGAGYSASLLARIGLADREPNAELALSRGNVSRTITLAGYNRLMSAGDWGRPLSFSSSVSAFLFGRDEGFYYRTSGAELRLQSDRWLPLEWRLFAERQRNAAQEAEFSVMGDFTPNITATSLTAFGAAIALSHSHGFDPRGFRVHTSVRLEGAGGDSTYGRGALELTLSRGLPSGLAAALTLAGGSTIGGVPPQRRWYLGGTHTIRGQSPDTAQGGNAFWMARAELGRDVRPVRVALFGDLGWAGDRTRLADVGRPLSGVGVGLSFFDGMVRFDVARGLHPREQFRLDLSLGARW